MSTLVFALWIASALPPSLPGGVLAVPVSGVDSSQSNYQTENNRKGSSRKEKLHDNERIPEGTVCEAELKAQMEAFGKALKEADKGKNPAGRDHAVTDFLQNWQDEVKAHAKAHAAVLGKWAKPPQYRHHKRGTAEYITAACVGFADKTPLETRLKSARAPSNLSQADKDAAKEVEDLVEVKKKRDTCKRGGFREARRCLDPYARYKWLDDVPLK